MDVFGSTDPKKMPLHFFYRCLNINYATAVRADINAQDFTVAPRHWYIDASFPCAQCKTEFVWSAQEQKTWFEEYRFYVDSQPTLCRECRAKRRNAIQLRKDYNALVAEARLDGSTELKHRIVNIVDELEAYSHRIPAKMRATRDLFRKSL